MVCLSLLLAIRPASKCVEHNLAVGDRVVKYSSMAVSSSPIESR